MADAGAASDRAIELIGGLFIEVVPYGRHAAHDGAVIRSAHPHFGLSLGDRACLALARSRDLPVITADRAWLELASALHLEVIAIGQTRERTEGQEEERKPSVRLREEGE